MVDEGVVISGVDVKREHVSDSAETDSEAVAPGEEHFAGTERAASQPRCMQRSQRARQLNHITPQHSLRQ